MTALEVINNELERLADEMSSITTADQRAQIAIHRAELYEMLRQASVSSIWVPDQSGIKVTYGTN